MAENITPNLDLEQILATLANLQQPDQITAQHHQQQQSSYINANHIHQQHSFPQSIPHHITPDPRLSRQNAQPPPRPQERTSTPLVDPSTIIEWKQGLRCVSKIAAQNPEFAAVVRKLMKDQESNVKQWESGRQRLIEDQKLKKENEKTNRDALSLPGLLDNTPILRTPEREQSELSLYDAKVYRASKAMVDSQSSSLKGLGVPFFGVKPYLVLHESEEGGDGELGAGGSGKINPKELLQLQRRMLGYLVELYGD